MCARATDAEGLQSLASRVRWRHRCRSQPQRRVAAVPRPAPGGPRRCRHMQSDDASVARRRRRRTWRDAMLVRLECVAPCSDAGWPARRSVVVCPAVVRRLCCLCGACAALRLLWQRQPADAPLPAAAARGRPPRRRKDETRLAREGPFGRLSEEGGRKEEKESDR